MACCVFTAYVMNRIIKACEILDINLILVQYNEFEEGPEHDDDNSHDNGLVVSKVSIDGMTCAVCVAAIENALSSLPGVEAVSVSLSLSRASIAHSSKFTSTSDIIAAIEGQGYVAHDGERTAQQNFELVQQASELSELRTAFSHSTMLATFQFSLEKIDSWLSLPSYLLTLRTLISLVIGLWVQVMNARRIHRKAWQNGLFSKPSMDTLISLSLLLGLILSIANMCLSNAKTANAYLSSGSFLTAVIVGGRCIDILLKRQTAKSLSQLYSLQSETNMVKVRRRDTSQSSSERPSKKGLEKQERIPALMLRPGDEIIIGPGSIIPCDSYVTSGRSVVNQSAMTGESLPVTKSTGDFLMSGTHNLTSQLIAIVSKPQEESALDQLVASISTATEVQANETKTDVLTRYFVQVIISLTICSAFVTYSTCDATMPLLTRLNRSGERAMAILASACPCALGLASPSAIMSGISVAWSRGIILRGGSSTIKKLDCLTHMVLDKTGTLTTGQLNVARIEGRLEHLHCMVICAVENQDALVHPVARTIFQWGLTQLDEGQRYLQNKIQFTILQSEPGKGVFGKIAPMAVLPELERLEIHIGTEAFLQDHNISIPCTVNQNLAHEMTVHVAIDRIHTATLYLQDTIRHEAPTVVNHLKSQLNLCLTMLTGDAAEEAQRVSENLGIEVLSSRALPHVKKEFVKQHQSQSNARGVAMVGDGLNDAAAISVADVGIVLSQGLSRSSRTCLQVADVILTTSSLTGLIDAVSIARSTVKQVRWNIRWALTYNVIAVALALGTLEPWGVTIDAPMAGTMMALSSVSVIAWSLWFRKELQKVGYEQR